MAANTYNQAEQSSLEESPSYSIDDGPNAVVNEDLHHLAEALGLTYPSNPKQINKASLVLMYLMGRKISILIQYIDSIPQREFYIDSFAKEIYLLRFSETISIYKKSEPISVPVIDKSELPLYTVQASLDDKSTREELNPDNKLVTKEVQYSLGKNPRKDIIEYKVRKELLTLIKANPGNIDRLEQMYDARGQITPFRWARDISIGFFNVLLGGRNQAGYDKLKDQVNKGQHLAAATISEIPADTDRDNLNKGGTK